MLQPSALEFCKFIIHNIALTLVLSSCQRFKFVQWDTENNKDMILTGGALESDTCLYYGEKRKNFKIPEEGI